MQRRSFGPVKYAALAVALAAATALAGCSSLAGVGGGSFAGPKMQVAELSNIGDYTADTALSDARAHFRNNDFGYSAALYKRVVELSPKNPDGYIGLSASYDRLGRFDLSDRVYGSWYALSGGTAQYYNNLGYSYMLRGKLTDALSNFRKAKDLQPDSVVVANNLQILSNTAAAARA
jgi:Flp pilus assembly protein TadD